LDERLRKSFPEHDCQTARYAGFAGLKNDELLKAAEFAKFEVLLTADQGFEYGQNLRNRQIAPIIFRTKSNRLNVGDTLLRNLVSRPNIFSAQLCATVRARGVMCQSQQP
jgi:hypothetical protein